MEQSSEVLIAPAKRGLRRRNRNWSFEKMARLVAKTPLAANGNEESF
jgi:hypothetical protein